jgi:hypothetical protein
MSDRIDKIESALDGLLTIILRARDQRARTSSDVS